MTEAKQQKIREEALSKLNTALDNLQSNNVDLRKKGERHLSDRSRMGLGDYKAKVVSEWFLDTANRDALFYITENESVDTIQAELLHTLYWVCDRHASRRFSDLPVDYDYQEKVKNFAEKFILNPSIPVLAAAAGLLTYFKDPRAWDLFQLVLQKKRDSLTIARFKYAYNDNDGAKIISKEQKSAVNKILKEIRSKSKNSEVISAASNLK